MLLKSSLGGIGWAWGALGCLEKQLRDGGRRIFNLHEKTIDKSPGFAKGTEICKEMGRKYESRLSL